MQELKDFRPLKPAEQTLLECCKNEKKAIIGKERPTEKTELNEIRAEFLRWLILVESVRINFTSIKFEGAWISGILDLSDRSCASILSFYNSYFESILNLQRATLKCLLLNGSFLKEGLFGDALFSYGDIQLIDIISENEICLVTATIKGVLHCGGSQLSTKKQNQRTLSCDYARIDNSVFLQNNFKSIGEVRFPGSKIGGDFICINGTFNSGDKSKALNCERFYVDKSVLLTGSFKSVGEVSFIAAKIKNILNCSGATFESSSADPKQVVLWCDGIEVNNNVFLRRGFKSVGEVRFVGGRIGGDLEFQDGQFTNKSETKIALNCSNIKINNRLVLSSLEEQNCVIDGKVFFSNALIGTLQDNENFWTQENFMEARLNGFKYNHISGNLNNLYHLHAMLHKMPKLVPQPYKQLTKVLRDMGHDKDADEVMIALHDKKLKTGNESLLNRVFYKLYKWTSGYGYRPQRAFGIMFFVWLSCGFIYDYSAKRAVFAPTNPLIYKPIYQDQPQETNCTLDANGTPWFASAEDYNTSKNNWYYATHAEYTTFQPYWYSLDILLPIVDLKMENDWSVAIHSPDGSFFKTYNYFVRSLVWIESLIGWGLSLMLAAILSGLAKNEKE